MSGQAQRPKVAELLVMVKATMAVLCCAFL